MKPYCPYLGNIVLLSKGILLKAHFQHLEDMPNQEYATA